MILIDDDLVNLIAHALDKNIEPLINPFCTTQLTPNGYDLSIAEVKVDDIAKKVGEDRIVVPPMTRFQITTKETLNLPDDITASLWLRTTYARKGIIVVFGYVDAGFCGKIVVNCFNCSKDNLTFERDIKKQTFCQIVFEKLHSTPAKNYATRSGNYQNQK